jgi:hypothetical protein
LRRPLGLVGVDEAHVEVRIDAHLLARHAVERESRGDLRHALRAVRHDDVLHHHEDQEDDEADHVIAAHHVAAHRGDHAAGIGIGQDEARGGDVERQAKERGDEQQRREGGELHRLRHVEREEQQQEGEAEVRQDQEVEQLRRDRREEHREHADHQQHQQDVGVVAEDLAQGVHRAVPGRARASRIARTHTRIRATAG